MAVVNLTVLNIVLNQQNANEPAEHACLRHLRNCFAHGLFQVHVQGPTMQVELHDHYPNGGAATFDARCDVEHVVDLAEHLLVASFNHASAIVHAPAAAAAAAPVPAVAAALPAGPPAPAPPAGPPAPAPPASSGAGNPGGAGTP